MLSRAVSPRLVCDSALPDFCCQKDPPNLVLDAAGDLSPPPLAQLTHLAILPVLQQVRQRTLSLRPGARHG